MTWKVINNVKLVDRSGDIENVTIQHDGNCYRIQNDFGNMFFEFDVSSGYDLIRELDSILTADIESEIVNFLNQKSRDDSDLDNDDPQIKLFKKENKHSKKGLSISKNGNS